LKGVRSDGVFAEDNLANKTALVTGASRGIGRATAQALAKEGAHVIVHYGRSAAKADAVVPEIREAPENLIGDNAYDSDKLDAELSQYGIQLIAPHRINRRNRTQDLRRLRRYRRR